MLIVIFFIYLGTGKPAMGAEIVLRSLSLFTLAMTISLTTKWTDMLNLVEKLLAPLSHIGLPSDSIALTAALVFRFVPQLLDRWSRLNECWNARSPRFVGIKLLVPWCLQALFLAERADECLRARMPKK